MSRTPKKKAVKKAVVKSSTSRKPISESPKLVENATSAMTKAFLNAKSPTEMRELGKQFMQNVLSHLSRNDAQIAFMHRHNERLVADINDNFDYMNRCLTMLFAGLHLEMPVRTPRLMDAEVELVAELDSGEVCEMQSSYSTKPHPTFGNIQIVIGVGNEAKTYGINGVHPIVAARLKHAFETLRESKTLVDGQFYYVRLKLFHAQPLGDESTKISSDSNTGQSDTAQVANGQPH